MAYTVVKTVNTGDNWTAKGMNRYVKDNFAAGIPDLMTTKGDMVSASGADAGVRLPAGPNGAYYIADSGATGGISCSIPSKVAALSATAQDIYPGNKTPFKLTLFDSETFDTSNAFAASRLTATHAGYYLLLLFGCYHNYTNTSWNNPDGISGEGERYSFDVWKNGVIYSTISTAFVQKASSAGLGGSQSVVLFASNGMDLIKLVAGDYIEIYANQNALAPQNPNYFFVNHPADNKRFWFRIAALS